MVPRKAISIQKVPRKAIYIQKVPKKAIYILKVTRKATYIQKVPRKAIYIPKVPRKAIFIQTVPKKKYNTKISQETQPWQFRAAFSGRGPKKSNHYLEGQPVLKCAIFTLIAHYVTSGLQRT
jgi:hypothetical protein